MRITVARSHAYRDFHNQPQKGGLVWEEKIVMPKPLVLAVAAYMRVQMPPAIDCGGPVV